MNDKPVFLSRSSNEWLFSLPVFCLLLLTLIIGTGEMIHGQLLRVGERIFGDPATGVQYFMLRADPTKPECNPHPDVDAEVQKQVSAKTNPGNDIDSLFADEPLDPVAVRESVITAAQLCQEKHNGYTVVSQHITPALKAYRLFETAFFAVFRFGTENRSVILVLMVVLAATLTTISRHHITLRPPHSRLDYRFSAAALAIANGFLLASTIAYMSLESSSNIPVEHPAIDYLWLIFFAAMLIMSVVHFIKPPQDAVPGGKVAKALLAVPIYAVMAIICGVFFLSRGHYAGLAIYLGKMNELSGIFLNLSLYIWCGMLLKQTRVVDMFLNILRPWNFSPEILTYLILLAAAIPTAYTGASGIFVIAAGGIVFREVLASGASRQYALAATAMSGSLGVVINPCLLVVVIAAMNKEVTTSQLYGWGDDVFFLTSTLFLIVSLLVARTKLRLAPPREAIPGMMKGFANVSPYIVITIGVVAFYQYLLNTKLDEFTASMIMPFIMLAIVAFDKLRRDAKTSVNVNPQLADDRRVGFEQAVRFATTETIGHMGALIILMGLSLCVGGMVERSEIMDYAPKEFSSIWMAMTFLVITKVLLGMIMDPFGAVILVSGTLAPIAYHNGIHPAHFWMMVLVAFELGYLLPPVALNQILTRQVMGEAEMEKADAEVRGEGFFRRYERWNLPVIVMTIGMLIVAYGPLFFYSK
ncbi:TRAP-type C4-dicarboxylate transport system permease large subunit [Fluviicoccus keumensis]|uniref:TRAP-type C4-dicarboxylate transport system permease large subunit n=1 Tax=Fluviicoccus keumensis TaxID=1435465 RepID=A0A4Q7YNP8_9GAMM|nr:TRAP transporter large permease subunit [Fluviicoccus keumensis]RZU38275.1 TRAP-type C4-dicarboxylate transport system permease large subunit [Fluviicoccus keumensis]